MFRIAALLGAAALVVTSLPAFAGEVSVAVAANFTKPAEEIGAAFTAKTGDVAVFSFGATGQLYAQIGQAAPFEVFLSADNKRPAQAVTDGLGVDGSVFTYAVGKVGLYSPSLDLTDGEAVLRANAFQHIAVADPESAPYGAAAMATLASLGLTDAVKGKIVTGENISQTLQFIDSANAELGFVALSQVVGKPAPQVWTVPADHYPPILQDAVLLKTGVDNPPATAFVDFLKGPEAEAIILKYGYAVAAD